MSLKNADSMGVLRLCRAVVTLLALSFASLNYAHHVVIDHKEIRKPLPGKSVAVGYMRIVNSGNNDVKLIGVRDSSKTNVDSAVDGGSIDGSAINESTKLISIEMHETVIQDNRSRMIRRDSVLVPAGGEVNFTPRGLHLMIFNWQVFNGDSKSLELVFDDGSQVDVEFPLSSW